MRFRGLAALAAVLLIVGSGRAAAQDTQSRVPESLRAQAAAGRRLRVIVGLREAAQPEGRLTGANVIRQRARIRRRADDLLSRLSPAGARRVRRFATIPFVAAEIDPATLLQLEGDPDVASIEEDVVSRPTLAQSVPLIGAPAAWQAGVTGAGWTVAILDTGVDAAHPFLAGRVVSEACYSDAGGDAGGIPLCPGGATDSVASGSGLNCDAAYQGCDHGTHVAGIAAGHGTTSSGVAPDATVLSIQVFTGFSAESGLCGVACVASFSSNQILALERVLALKDTLKIAAVNMSLGGSVVYTDTASCDAANASRKAAIDNLRSVGIATVVSAGNGGNPGALSAPACISSAVSVGSTTKADPMTHEEDVSSFSNAAPFLSLMAPGESIVSSIPGGGFAAFSGTSMAAPHVTGAWALIRSRAPQGSVDEILAALRSTGAAIADERVAPPASYPRLRVDAALASITATDVHVNLPAANTHVAQPFALSGWAIAAAALGGPGIDAIHVYAIDGGGQAAFLGAAPYGGPRDDVGSLFGARFTDSGFYLRVSGLPAGPYLLVAYAHNAATSSFDGWATRSVVVDPLVSQPHMTIDRPGAGEVVAPAFTITGWALDAASAEGTGVDAIHAYAIPSGGDPVFLGASYGGARRDDVGAAYGAQFRDSGYAITTTLAPGAYTLVVYARSTVSGTFTPMVTSIVVRPPGAPAMSVDVPGDGTTAAAPFVLSGWAADLDATADNGVDAVHVWAMPLAGGPAQFAGAAICDAARDDVAAAFGSQFRFSGFNLSVALPPGSYLLVVYAHSSITGTFSQSRALIVNVV